MGWGGVREKRWYHWHLGWSLNDNNNTRHFAGIGKEDGVSRQRSLMEREGLFRERIWFWVSGVLGKKRGSKVEGMLHPEPRREAQGMLTASTGKGGANMAKAKKVIDEGKAVDSGTGVRLKERGLTICLFPCCCLQGAQLAASREGLDPVQHYPLQEWPKAAAGGPCQPAVPRHQGLCGHPCGYSQVRDLE